MKKLVLLPRNLVLFSLSIGCPDYSQIILPLIEHRIEGVYVSVPYNDSDTWEEEFILQEDITPLPLVSIPKSLLGLLRVQIPECIPPHIEFFHELQNWFYFTTGKELINFENLDDRDGDLWIDISKMYGGAMQTKEK